MSAEKIAVDVVLIPPDEILQLAIDINKTFPDTREENYVLDAKTCVPHITLLMGLITKEQVSEVGRKLGAIAEKFSALTLTITHIKNWTRPDGKILSSLEIEKTPELQKLHEVILEAMSSIFTYDGVIRDMFYSSPPVYETPLSWVKGFVKTAVRENYQPHITLGVGEPKKKISPIQFCASTIALCHLGNHCTCREILWSSSLL